ncbi:checkpoint clamp complex protein Rad9 [Schizosaccharomyces octosporus yFS286]|uniref:DNA repair protein rad9 n=2 Tax=Schizosaccharomyces octosporus TaxID=4899 RepID=RAD9_SCHOT|nr:checkpoint clamp complex protein Rad9 [Schizosaccharomyces octosporus yFS286]P48013.1 RecName: Full=DNA repair protein rad9 [Schizosaccharomyces octosporus]EPX71324.1 checkpoint clamp complex protein Rad9 [Schizosaccharomyces octosporus yFS286]CAA54492.1 rad9 [Schizosaccharomyces octosporus]
MEFVVSNTNLRDLSRIFLNLSRIDDAVNWEINKDQLILTTLNSSRSGFGKVTLTKKFFDKFTFHPDTLFLTGFVSPTVRLSTQIKPILSIFRNKIFESTLLVNNNLNTNAGAAESSSKKNVVVENIQMQITSGKECRVIFKFNCKHGVVKTYKIAYEQTQTLHAVFDKASCHNNWQINSKILKDLIEHFGQKTEELTIQPVQGRVLLTSFTEEVVHNKDVLKQPTQTTVSIDGKEFEQVSLNEGIIITLSLKEFRAAVLLAESLGTSIASYYSVSGKPALFTFNKGKFMEIEAQFILATVMGPDDFDESSLGARWQQSGTANSSLLVPENTSAAPALENEAPSASIGWQTNGDAETSRMFHSTLDIPRNEEPAAKPSRQTTDEENHPLFLEGMPDETELMAFDNDVADDAEFGPTQHEQTYHGIFSQDDTET